jgi:hypothetical protein
MLLHEMLLSGSPFCQKRDGSLRHAPPLPEAILSGSFNPFHQGHQALGVVATQRLGLDVDFELSISNVDKPELDAAEVAKRLTQFRSHFAVWVTRAPTFIEKARLFPGVVMVVGYDTARRILDPQYYRGDARLRDAALRFLRDRDCSFLVAGRADPNGTFLGLDDLDIPPEGDGIFDGLSESEFRLDVSSTELRRKMQDS